MSGTEVDLPPNLTERIHAASRQALLSVVNSDDPAIVGVVLTGSAARGTSTEVSDVDVIVVRDDASPRRVQRSEAIDEIPMSLAELENVPPFGTDGWWFRWSFAYAVVLRDKTDGGLDRAIRRQATVTPDEQRQILIDHDRLDGYINFAYRALKSARNGRAIETQLDAAEGVPWLLDVVFTLAGRVRPYNSYLAWALTTHPLPESVWPADPLLALLGRMIDGSPDAVAAGFRSVEHACRDYDRRNSQTTLGDIIDAWGSELAILRGR